MAELKLVIFDVDGTLVDSLANIKWAMGVAFEACDLTPPAAEDVRRIVGLSLPQAMARLSPGASDTECKALVTAYSEAFASKAEARPETNFFSGALECLRCLNEQDETLLAIATGKSRRGMNRILNTCKLGNLFQSVQVADDHPSKPNPSMIHSALADTGVDPERAVMIGDTTFDMDMGRAGGVRTIGVSWGYHTPAELEPRADAMISDFEALPASIERLIGERN